MENCEQFRVYSAAVKQRIIIHRKYLISSIVNYMIIIYILSIKFFCE